MIGDSRPVTGATLGARISQPDRDRRQCQPVVGGGPVIGPPRPARRPPTARRRASPPCSKTTTRTCASRRRGWTHEAVGEACRASARSRRPHRILSRPPSSVLVAKCMRRQCRQERADGPARIASPPPPGIGWSKGRGRRPPGEVAKIGLIDDCDAVVVGKSARDDVDPRRTGVHLHVDDIATHCCRWPRSGCGDPGIGGHFGMEAVPAVA